MEKTDTVDEKHEESAEADGGPEHSCDQRPGADDARNSVQRGGLRELSELFVLLVATIMTVTMLATPTSPGRRLEVARNVCRHGVARSAAS